MPRFFFQVRIGQDLIPDPEGSELPNLAAAQDEALASLRRLVAERLRSSHSNRITIVHQIEVADEAGVSWRRFTSTTRWGRWSKREVSKMSALALEGCERGQTPIR
jgi:hypothetical protein